MRTPEDTPPAAAELLRFGTIAEVDLAGARCVVRVGDVLTGPIRWAEMRAGKTRTWSPPSVNEQILLLCPEGELEAGVALRGVGCDAYPAPGHSLRELMEFEDGAVLAYDPVTHALDVLLPAGATVRFVATGGVTIDASDGGVTIKGDVEVEGDVTAKGVSLIEHRHGQVQAGGAQSGKPV